MWKLHQFYDASLQCDVRPTSKTYHFCLNAEVDLSTSYSSSIQLHCLILLPHARRPFCPNNDAIGFSHLMFVLYSHTVTLYVNGIAFNQCTTCITIHFFDHWPWPFFVRWTKAWCRNPTRLLLSSERHPTWWESKKALGKVVLKILMNIDLALLCVKCRSSNWYGGK